MTEFEARILRQQDDLDRQLSHFVILESVVAIVVLLGLIAITVRLST